jgi:hypothetical protein
MGIRARRRAVLPVRERMRMTLPLFFLNEEVCGGLLGRGLGRVGGLLLDQLLGCCALVRSR